MEPTYDTVHDTRSLRIVYYSIRHVAWGGNNGAAYPPLTSSQHLHAHTHSHPHAHSYH